MRALSRTSLRVALYAMLIAYGMIRFAGSPGDDLSSSYVACHLMADGGQAHLYDHHPERFHVVDSPAWTDKAREIRFEGFLHPYVQTPLWAWALQPLCTSLDYGSFSTLFLFLALFSIALMIELAARFWAPRFLAPLPLALLLGAIAATTPFSYALWLIQTHAMFLAMAMGAAILADRKRYLPAGVLLSVAATVKITPALLAIHWLSAGRYKAAFWFTASSALLLAGTLAILGTPLAADYLGSMHRVSDVLLIAYNNQSLAAWLAYSDAMATGFDDWRALPLPEGLKLASAAASLAGVAIAGLLARRPAAGHFPVAIALISLTAFTPIAWTHYYIVLIPAVMILLQRGSPGAWAVSALVFLMNVEPLAVDPFDPMLGPLALIRGHFLSALILLAALLVHACEGLGRHHGDIEQAK